MKCKRCGNEVDGDPRYRRYCSPCRVVMNKERYARHKDRKRRGLIGVEPAKYAPLSECWAALALAIIDTCHEHTCGECPVDGWCGKAREGVA